MKQSPQIVTISVVGMVLAALGLYFGSLLPLLKAQSFIEASKQVEFVRSVDEFKDNFDQMFNLYSPVGDEEVTKFLGSSIRGILSQAQPEPVARELVAYIEPHLYKNDVRHLLLLSQMYEFLWGNYKQDADYQKAVIYLETAREIGPNLPPPLYKLLNLYASRGDQANFDRIGREIYSRWPEDKNVAPFFQ